MTAKTTQLEFENQLLRQVIEQQRQEIERLKLERDDALFDSWRGERAKT